MQISNLEKSKGKSQPVYRQIIERLRKGIESQDIKPGEYLSPAYQLAKKWNVGYSTINTVIKNLEQEGLITTKTEWGKGPLVLGPAKPSKIQTIMFIRWARISQYLALEDGVRKYFENTDNTEVLTVDVNKDLPLYLNTFKHMIGQVTGTILYPWDSPECVAAISNIINNGVKVVFVDRTIPGVDASSVAIDHFRGSYQATEHLIQNHKLPVHFFGNISGSSACCLRYTGYSEAMYEYGYHDLSKYVFELSKPEVHIADASRSKTAHIVEKDAEKFIDQCMTADKFCVTTQNDDSALAVYNEALKRGIKIGQQLFLVGFSDRPFCTKLPVPLSSVAQFDDRVGYEAAKLLHKMLQSDFERPVHITIPPELRIRKSSVFG